MRRQTICRRLGWLICVTLCSTLSAQPTTVGANNPSPWSIARSEVVTLAREGKVSQIEAAVQNAQAKFERGQNDHHHLSAYLDGISDRRLPFFEVEAQLNSWVGSNPHSYAARLLRGVYLADAGGRARGTGWSRETPSDQFTEMRKLYARAQEDLLAAAELTRVPLHARVHLMLMSLIGGGASNLMGNTNLLLPTPRAA